MHRDHRFTALEIRLNGTPRFHAQLGPAQNKPNYEPAKAAQIIAYFAMKSPWRSIELPKAMLMVYLAERQYVHSYGKPMLMEARYATPAGPRNHQTYELASGNVDQPAEWLQFVHPCSDNDLIRVRKQIQYDDLDMLSRACVKTLEKTWEQFGDLDCESILAWLRDNASECIIPNTGRLPIPLASMLHAAGVPNAWEVADDHESYMSVSAIMATPIQPRVISNTN